MSRHLNHDQISAVVAGETGPEAAAHLEDCQDCRREVEQFENVLGHFRGSVRAWSDGQVREGIRVQPRTRAWPRLAYACMIAALVLLCVVANRLPVPSKRNVAVAPSALESDTLLLKRVSADVSRSVPPGMETLLGFNTTGTVQR